MPGFVITRDVMKSVTQRVYVEAETEEEALRLSEKDDPDAVQIVDETLYDTYEIQNGAAILPEMAYSYVRSEIMAAQENEADVPFDFAGHHFENLLSALAYYLARFHIF